MKANSELTGDLDEKVLSVEYGDTLKDTFPTNTISICRLTDGSYCMEFENEFTQYRDFDDAVAGLIDILHAELLRLYDIEENAENVDVEIGFNIRVNKRDVEIFGDAENGVYSSKEEFVAKTV